MIRIYDEERNIDIEAVDDSKGLTWEEFKKIKLDPEKEKIYNEEVKKIRKEFGLE